MFIVFGMKHVPSFRYRLNVMLRNPFKLSISHKKTFGFSLANYGH